MHLGEGETVLSSRQAPLVSTSHHYHAYPKSADRAELSGVAVGVGQSIGWDFDGMLSEQIKISIQMP